ncbi:lipopolysaccharide kinase InaA family protein [Bacteroides sp. 224]|uniref:lipopolysaccharide kinase InaA family protein n=1 Tax=Bacteroides sp. 224 TaxID=2302936 RepID=UPI0013D1A7F5|nr:lipopolysaccharide kinase InaA family protein [Bacteroides sp. 224]NDV64293.1 tyrosine protein kinase [Bacteroides sp. 224]
MKFEINPKYTSYIKEIQDIPRIFESEGEVVYGGRNLIKRIIISDLDLNVKRYKVPNLFNRVIYTFFRKPKGERAFIYPSMLLSAGIETPEPVAYIQESKLGLIHYSYFISIQSSYRYNFYQFGNAKVEDFTDVVVAFANFTARMHEANVLHHDYSPGNILFDKIDDKYHFCLVDINRMSFKQVSIEEGCANFARLWGQPAFFELLAKEYAKARNADEDFCREKIFAYRKKFWKRFSKKHKVKYNLKF